MKLQMEKNMFNMALNHEAQETHKGLLSKNRTKGTKLMSWLLVMLVFVALFAGSSLRAETTMNISSSTTVNGVAYLTSTHGDVTGSCDSDVALEFHVEGEAASGTGIGGKCIDGRYTIALKDVQNTVAIAYKKVDISVHRSWYSSSRIVGRVYIYT